MVEIGCGEIEEIEEIPDSSIIFKSIRVPNLYDFFIREIGSTSISGSDFILQNVGLDVDKKLKLLTFIPYNEFQSPLADKYSSYDEYVKTVSFGHLKGYDSICTDSNMYFYMDKSIICTDAYTIFDKVPVRPLAMIENRTGERLVEKGHIKVRDMEWTVLNDNMLLCDTVVFGKLPYCNLDACAKSLGVKYSKTQYEGLFDIDWSFATEKPFNEFVSYKDSHILPFLECKVEYELYDKLSVIKPALDNFFLERLQ